MKAITVHTIRQENLEDFLLMHGFEVEAMDVGVSRVSRDDELPVYIHIDEQSLYFNLDLGSISSIADAELYFKLLDLNTEIQPVSFGIDTTNQDPRLVLVESRVTGDLSDQELLSVFDALELATDRRKHFGSYLTKE